MIASSIASNLIFSCVYIVGRKLPVRLQHEAAAGVRRQGYEIEGSMICTTSHISRALLNYFLHEITSSSGSLRSFM